MGTFILAADVPTIEPEEAERLISDIEVEALRLVPQLAAFGYSRATVAAFRRIVLRWHIETPAAIAQQSALQFGMGLSSKRAGWTITTEELDAIKGAAGVAAASSGTPRGSFPAGRVNCILNLPAGA